MHTFELVLILLMCVIVSSPFDQVLKKVSLPLVQVAIGFVVALFVPQVAGVYVDPELFLVLFIAPLLFNEARESHKRDLWNNLGSILSLAIGLVLLTVLVVGFTLNWLVPSIPLAAAFACAGALGPTDAAAVSALGSTITLSRRQKTLLSGEALINDASGVVSFQFALAAALTGAFSAAEAGTSFLVLFFGGILAGLVLGAAAVLSVTFLRRRGFENTVVHVLYEVTTPFIVFLAAEAVHVSGILAVVAAGLVMANSRVALASTEVARQQVLSNGVWEVLVFLINGILFVLLGMQLPNAMSPTLHSEFDLVQLVAIICIMTALVIGVRFVWVSVIELFHRDSSTGERGIAHVGRTLKDALVTTIAGPKGAVTLSIIFTIPYVMGDGSPFPNRDLIIFLTSGTILLTLLVANFALPLLAGQGDADDETELRQALIEVLEATLQRIRVILKADEHAEYVPALRLVAARYRSRLFMERIQMEGFGDIMTELMDNVFELQQARADEIQSGRASVSAGGNAAGSAASGSAASGSATAPAATATAGSEPTPGSAALAPTPAAAPGGDAAPAATPTPAAAPGGDAAPAATAGSEPTPGSATERTRVGVRGAAPYYAMLRDIRRSVGYGGKSVKVGSRFRSVRGMFAMLWQTAFPTRVQDERTERIYYDTCLFAIDLERVAVDYLEGIASENDGQRSEIAQVLANEHQSACESLWGRINYGQDFAQDPNREIVHEVRDDMPEDMRHTFGEQFRAARKHAEEADARALEIELEEIGRLRAVGSITKQQARDLRESVYLMQMTLAE